MNANTFIMSAIGHIVGRENYEIISKQNGFNILYNPNGREILRENSDVLSLNQKVALFVYIYIYCRLEKKETVIEKRNELLETFLLPKSLVKTCDDIITGECIDYILKDSKNCLANPVELFFDPGDYINDIVTYIVELPLIYDKKILSNLQSSEYEHKSDKIALEKLRLNLAMEKIIKLCFEYDVERLLKIQYTGSCVRVTEKNIPYLYNALIEVCRVLNVESIPPLYLEQGFINANTQGIKEPIIVLSNSSISLLTYDELLFILGHEVGHIKSQHVLYHSIGSILPYIGDLIGNITLGIGGIVSGGIELALYNWQRASEYTADRAGLLACQNIDAAISVMYKLAGMPVNCYQNIDVNDFLNQADEFKELDVSKFNKIMKTLSAAYNTHPWTVMRAKELKQWIDDGKYEQIMSSTYDFFCNKSNTYYCPNCRAKLLENANFCNNCGTRVKD